MPRYIGLRSLDIMADHLADEANIALERGLPTVRSTGWDGFPEARFLVERDRPLRDAFIDVMDEHPEKLADALLALLRLDAEPDAALKCRNFIAREIARFNAADILTAQRIAAEEAEHG